MSLPGGGRVSVHACPGDARSAVVDFIEEV
jgi:hypothetical protein